MHDDITFYVTNFSKAVSWYAHHLKCTPLYADNTWAIFLKNGVKLTIINEPLVKMYEQERLYASFNPATADSETLVRLAMSARAGDIEDVRALTGGTVH